MNKHVHNAGQLKATRQKYADDVLKLMRLAQKLSPDHADHGAMLMLMGAACLARKRQTLLDAAAVAYDEIHGGDDDDD
jgi:hypothetical protein